MWGAIVIATDLRARFAVVVTKRARRAYHQNHPDQNVAVSMRRESSRVECLGAALEGSLRAEYGVEMRWSVEGSDNVGKEGKGQDTQCVRCEALRAVLTNAIRGMGQVNH